MSDILAPSDLVSPDSPITQQMSCRIVYARGARPSKDVPEGYVLTADDLLPPPLEDYSDDKHHKRFKGWVFKHNNELAKVGDIIDRDTLLIVRLECPCFQCKLEELFNHVSDHDIDLDSMRVQFEEFVTRYNILFTEHEMLKTEFATLQERASFDSYMAECFYAMLRWNGNLGWHSGHSALWVPDGFVGYTHMLGTVDDHHVLDMGANFSGYQYHSKAQYPNLMKRLLLIEPRNGVNYGCLYVTNHYVRDSTTGMYDLSGADGYHRSTSAFTVLNEGQDRLAKFKTLHASALN